jgi:hypothetical protein
VNRKSLSGIIRDCSLQSAFSSFGFSSGPSQTGIQLIWRTRGTGGFNSVLFQRVSIAPARLQKNGSTPQDFQVVKV